MKRLKDTDEKISKILPVVVSVVEQLEYREQFVVVKYWMSISVGLVIELCQLIVHLLPMIIIDHHLFESKINRNSQCVESRLAA